MPWMRDPGPKASIFVAVITVLVVVGAVEVAAAEGTGASGVGMDGFAEATLDTSESAKPSKIMRRFILRVPQGVGQRLLRSFDVAGLSGEDFVP